MGKRFIERVTAAKDVSAVPCLTFDREGRTEADFVPGEPAVRVAFEHSNNSSNIEGLTLDDARKLAKLLTIAVSNAEMGLFATK